MCFKYSQIITAERLHHIALICKFDIFNQSKEKI